ncbi:MAG: hypothetical protein Q9210_006871 [Variospora velana]
MEEILLQSLESRCSPDDPVFQRILAQCAPPTPESQAILDKPHPNETLDTRLLEALAPKWHDLEMDAFDVKLAAQYQEAYIILRTGGTKDRLSNLHFISQPITEFKTPSKVPSLFELFLAYKTCLFRAVLDPSEGRECLKMMMMAFKSLNLRGEELRRAVTVIQEVILLLGLRFELDTRLRVEELAEKHMGKKGSEVDGCCG